MDTVASVVKTIFTIALRIKSTVEQVRHNAKQFHLLAERTQAILNFIDGSDRHTLQLEPLQRVQRVLYDCALLAEKYTQRSVVSRVLRKGGDRDQIAELTKQLNEAIFDLNVNLSMQQIFEAHRDRSALEEDLRAMEASLLAQGDRHEMHLAQQDAALGQVQSSQGAHAVALYQVQCSQSAQHDMLADIQRQLQAMCAAVKEPASDAEVPLIAPEALSPDPLCRNPVIGSATYGVITAMLHGGVPVAVKSLHEHVAGPDAVTGLRRELFLMRLLTHPNVVCAIGGHFDPNDPARTFLVMERHVTSLRGYLTTLRKEKRVLTEREVLLLAAGACHGLGYLQAQGIVHRDLHSGNLLLDKSFTVKITDLGLSKAIEPNQYLGTLAGAPVSAAPEVLIGRYGLPADVWSLGILLAELALGRVPAVSAGQAAEGDIARHVSPEEASKARELAQQARGGERDMACLLARRKAILDELAQAGSHASLGPLVRDCLQLNPHRRWDIATLLQRIEALQASPAVQTCATPNRDAFIVSALGIASPPTPPRSSSRDVGDAASPSADGDDANARFDLGKGLLENGQKPEAISHFQAALRHGYSSPALVHHALGLCLADSKEAMPHFEKAIELDSSNTVFLCDLSSTLLALGRFAEAATQIEKVLLFDSGHLRAHSLYGLILGKLSRDEEAIPHFLRAIDGGHEVAASHDGLGECMLRLGRNEEALGHFEAAIEQDPGSARSHALAGCALLNLDRHDAATARFEAATQLDPGLTHHEWGSALSSLERYEEAIPHCEQAVRAGYDASEAYSSWGLCLVKLKRHGEALTRFEAAIRHNPDPSWRHYANAGEMLYHLGRNQEATARFESAARLDAGPAHFRWGTFLQTVKRHEDAIPHFQQAAQLEHQVAEAHNQCGMCLSQLDRPKEALSCYEEAIRCAPSKWVFHANAGDALMHMRQRREQEAIARFEAAVELDPGPAHYQWGNSFWKRCDRTSKLHSITLTHFQKAAQLGYKVAKSHNKWGLCLRAINNRSEEEALFHFKEAIRLEPSCLRYYINAADVLLFLQRNQEATAMFESAVRLDEGAGHFKWGKTLVASCWASTPEEAITHLEQAIKLGYKVSRAHFHWGAALYSHDERTEEALPHYVEAIRLDPNHPSQLPDLIELAANLKDMGWEQEATTWFEAAAQLDPKTANFEWGRVHRRFFEYEGAIPFFEEALRHGHEACASLIGDCLFELERYEEALPWFKKAIHLQESQQSLPDPESTHYRYGVSLFMEEQYRDAIVQLEAALKLRPDAAEYRKKLHYARERERKYQAWNRRRLDGDQASDDDDESDVEEPDPKLGPSDARARFDLGKDLLKNDQKLEAIPKFREALRLGFGSPSHAHHALGLCFADSREAIPHFEKAVDQNPSNATFRCDLGNALLALGRFEEAANRVKRVFEYNPGHLRAHSLYGSILAKLSRDEDAIRHFQRAIDGGHEPAASPHCGLGECMLRLGRNEEALGYFEAAIAHDPTIARSHVQAGCALLNLDRHDAATARFEAATQLDPGFAQYEWGESLYSLELYEEAIPHYKQAARLNYSASKAYSSRGLCLNKLDRYDEALPCFEAAIRHDPDHLFHHTNAADMLYRLDRHQEAEARFESAVQLDAGLGQYQWGLALVALDRYEEAIPHFQQATQSEDQAADAHNQCGICLYRLDRPEEALTHYTKAIRLNSGQFFYHTNAGEVLYELGRMEEAATRFEAALRLDAGRAQYHWGDALKDINRHEDAIPHFEKAAQLGCNASAAHNECGNCCIRLNRIDDAILHYEAGIQLDPENARLHSNLGRSLHELGRIRESLLEFEAAVKFDPGNEEFLEQLDAAREESSQVQPDPIAAAPTPTPNLPSSCDAPSTSSLDGPPPAPAPDLPTPTPTPAQVPAPAPAPAPNPMSPGTGTQRRMRVIADYLARDQFQLSAPKGDVVTLQQKDSAGAGWATVADASGKQGLFPMANLVAVDADAADVNASRSSGCCTIL